MKIAIVCALKDQASKTIFEELKKLGLPSWATTYIFDCNTIDVPLEEVNEDEIIVLSKHSSKAGNKSLTVHHLGNYNTADFGGEPKTLVNSMPKITTNLLRGLNENNSNEEFSVCYEVTHHGPFTNKKVVFIELGSTINEWDDKIQAKVIAKTIIDFTLKENNDNIVIGIGGGHYSPDFTKLALRQNYSFGHICPQYALEYLDKEILDQMIAKSNASEIILDWKGLKGNKERISLLCEQTSLKISRVQQLLKK